MKKKVISVTLVAALILSMLTIGVFSVSAADDKIVKNRVTFKQSGTDTEELPAGTNKADYIAGKKSDFETRVRQIAGANGEIADYSSFFTENTYAVVESIGWGGQTIEQSDDAIVIGDIDDWNNLYVVRGWIAKVTTYIVNYKLVTINDGAAQKLIGDVNGDNNVDVLDATIIQKYASGKADLTDAEKYVADVNNDNNVDVLDASDIQKYASGIITEFKKKT